MAIIQDAHDNVVALGLNGQRVSDSPLLSTGENRGGKGRLNDLEAWLRGLSLAELFRLVDDLDAEDMRFLEEGVRVNLRLAEHGLKYGSGLGLGKLRHIPDGSLLCAGAR